MVPENREKIVAKRAHVENSSCESNDLMDFMLFYSKAKLIHSAHSVNDNSNK